MTYERQRMAMDGQIHHHHQTLAILVPYTRGSRENSSCILHQRVEDEAWERGRDVSEVGQRHIF